MRHLELTQISRDSKFGLRDLLSAFWARIRLAYKESRRPEIEKQEAEEISQKAAPQQRQ